MAREHCRVFYSGRVQGVGFRFTTERLARGFEVAGWVRNLDNGSVEVVAEGESDELAAFLDAIAEVMKGKIHKISLDRRSQSPSDPPLSGFSIRD